MKDQLENLRAADRLFLDAASGKKFSDELNRLIEAQGVSLKTHSFNVKVDISGAGGRFDVLDENTTKTDGVSTISGNRLPKNQGVLFNKIGIFHGVGDTTKKGGVKFETALPAALQNATLGIRQRGISIIERPVSDFQAKGAWNEPKEQVLDLEIPQFLRDDEAIEMYLQFPSGVSMATATSGSELLAQIKIWGVSTERKA